jgi:hypothetical protein
VRDGTRSRRSRQGCLIRVGAGAWSRFSVELASYETDLECGFEVGFVLLWLSRFFVIDDVGTPMLLVPTQTFKKFEFSENGMCVMRQRSIHFLTQICCTSQISSYGFWGVGGTNLHENNEIL